MGDVGRACSNGTCSIAMFVRQNVTVVHNSLSQTLNGTYIYLHLKFYHKK